MNKYLGSAMRTPRFDTAVIEPHRRFLRSLHDRRQLHESGGFTDGTGGACVIYAESHYAATQIAFSDPVHRSGSSELTIYGWEVTAPN
ncbi:YciI family protein [Nocardia sp. R7R-8]|uniref:YciI family protein n=1 Tax=Nocardia sp. R7R-8 TaxID=3459304 RepID=UPI00403DDDA1